MDLQLRLDQVRAHWLEQQPAPAHAVELMAMDHLRRSGLEGRALAAGERAPSFRLADGQGGCVSLESLLEQGPVTLLFDRGEWCDYGRQTLAAYSSRAEAFAALRTSLLVVLPEGGDGSNIGTPSAGLRVVADPMSHVARAYGLVYEMPRPLRDLYEHQYGVRMPDVVADGGWSLPVPASFVIAPNGRVLRSTLHLDYRRREDPAVLLSYLAQLPDSLWMERSA